MAGFSGIVGGISAAFADFGGRALRRKFCSAVIVAAGSGSRMGDTDRPKQFLPLLGKPVLLRAAEAFECCSFIREIIVVTRREDITRTETLLGGISKLRRVVAGGETRQQSSLAGFDAISEKCDYVALHDAARCLTTPAMIERVFTEATRHGAAIAACRASDTVKTADGLSVASTPDRSTLWYAQTPQVFLAELYRASAYFAREREFTATDDASLAEDAGFDVRLVDCGTENFKITTPVDLLAAEALLRLREESAAADGG